MEREKFRNTYRIESTRLQTWDYSSDGLYFITICTHNRACILGTVINGKMVLSSIGEIVVQEWKKSFVIRTELFCEEFIIMPNHIHAILRINNSTNICISQKMKSSDSFILQLKAKSISSFVAGFKSIATKRINEYRNTPKYPVWQPRFHDHIIRDKNAYHNIKNYIKNNPLKWNNDVFKNRNFDF